MADFDKLREVAQRLDDASADDHETIMEAHYELVTALKAAEDAIDKIRSNCSFMADIMFKSWIMDNVEVLFYTIVMIGALVFIDGDILRFFVISAVSTFMVPHLVGTNLEFSRFRRSRLKTIKHDVMMLESFDSLISRINDTILKNRDKITGAYGGVSNLLKQALDANNKK